MKDLKEFINESSQPEYPNIKTLGDGEYEGVLWGRTFIYNEQKYTVDYGTLSMFPSYFNVNVNGDDVKLIEVDDRQRPELVKLFNS